jgi:phosphotransferase family enzyme
MADPANGFETVLERLKSDVHTPFGAPGAVVEALRRIDGPYSSVLRVRVRSGERTTYAYIKVSRPRDATAEEAARVQRFLLREYLATCRLRDAFDGRTDVGALRPIALLPEAHAIVTEEVSGQPLGALVRRARHPDASLLECFRRVGCWVRLYQTLDSPAEGVDLSERRAYLDERLSLLEGRILTTTVRREVLARVDALRERAGGRPIPAVPIHADLTPTNVIIGADGRVTVLDFAMAKTGTAFHDLAHMHFHLSLAASRHRNRQSLYEALQRALLVGYDNTLTAADPLFQLMLWQHAVCHVAMLAERRLTAGDFAYRWFVKRRWRSCVRALTFSQ